MMSSAPIESSLKVLEKHFSVGSFCGAWPSANEVAQAFQLSVIELSLMQTLLRDKRSDWLMKKEEEFLVLFCFIWTHFVWHKMNEQ